MTTAVCVFCGAMKVGAWTPCDSCGQVPTTEAERIRALASTDRYHDASTLERLAAVVRKGGQIELDEESTASLRRMLRTESMRTLAESIGLGLPGSPADDNRPPAPAAPREWEFWKEPSDDETPDDDSPDDDDDFERAVQFDAEGLEAMAEKDWERADSLFSAAIDLDASYWEPWHHRGKTRLSGGRFQRAIADLDRALDLAPIEHRAEVLNDRGIAKRKIGDAEGAIADYDAALDLSPALYRVLLNRGIARYEVGDRVGACADFRRAEARGVRGAASAARQAGCSESQHAAAAGRTQATGAERHTEVRWTFPGDPPCETVTFESNGGAVIAPRKGYSPVHAISHIWLRQLPTKQLGQDDFSNALRQLESWAGVKGGRWTFRQEELAVEQIERYFVRQEPGLKHLLSRPDEDVSEELESVLATLARSALSRHAVLRPAAGRTTSATARHHGTLEPGVLRAAVPQPPVPQGTGTGESRRWLKLLLLGLALWIAVAFLASDASGPPAPIGVRSSSYTAPQPSLTPQNLGGQPSRQAETQTGEPPVPAPPPRAAPLSVVRSRPMPDDPRPVAPSRQARQAVPVVPQVAAARRPTPRPPNGHVLKREGPGGLSLLRITNGTGHDAAVLLESDTATLSMYVWNGQQAALEHISAGQYRLRFMLGTGFENDHFIEGAGFSEFDSGVDFQERQESDGRSYSEVSVTLHTVRGGTERVEITPPFRIPQ
jgi:tetratricopeptide (TPR) repeat protein